VKDTIIARHELARRHVVAVLDENAFTYDVLEARDQDAFRGVADAVRAGEVNRCPS